MLKDTKLNRRDALKTMGASGLSLLMLGSSKADASTKLSVPSSKKKAKIVIVGGGTGGITVAARLRRSVPNAQITLIAPNTVHLYQSGQVYAAAGLYTEFDNKRQTLGLIPDGVTWMQEKVADFDPDHNRMVTDKGSTLSYDYLVVALGCEYDFSRIEGIDVFDIGKKGIASVYLNDMVKGTSDGAVISEMWLKSIRREASRKKLKVLLCDPDTPVKGEGVSLDMLFLANDMLRGNGPKNGLKKGEDLHKKVHFTLTKAEQTLFPSKPIEKVLQKVLKRTGNTESKMEHKLIAVDKEKKVARFDTKEGVQEFSYDYLHITPPMQAPQVLRESKLAIEEGTLKGWMEIDEKTLRHPKYVNVFGIGDVLGIPVGKSGGAIREQAITIQDNLASALEGQKLSSFYDGYSVAPIKTQFGRVLLAEYNKKGLSPTFPLDPTKTRWIWWEMDLHLMRTAYFELMMRGMM